MPHSKLAERMLRGTGSGDGLSEIKIQLNNLLAV